MPDPAPPKTGTHAPAPLWAEGGLRLRVRPPSGGPARVARISRPFALIGRGAGADLRINNPSASTRHVYLHLDHRGLFGVDLATRSGTRFRGADRATAWLRPGDTLEVADHRIEVLDARADGQGPAGAPTDPLGDAPGAPCPA